MAYGFQEAELAMCSMPVFDSSGSLNFPQINYNYILIKVYPIVSLPILKQLKYRWAEVLSGAFIT